MSTKKYLLDNLSNRVGRWDVYHYPFSFFLISKRSIFCGCYPTLNRMKAIFQVNIYEFSRNWLIQFSGKSSYRVIQKNLTQRRRYKKSQNWIKLLDIFRIKNKRMFYSAYKILKKNLTLSYRNINFRYDFIFGQNVSQLLRMAEFEHTKTHINVP